MLAVTRRDIFIWNKNCYHVYIEYCFFHKKVIVLEQVLAKRGTSSAEGRILAGDSHFWSQEVITFKGESFMETWFYVIESIDGDYANLRRTDIESDDLKLVARALLPDGIAEGTQLKYELMQYTIVED